ncbi:hypothetical protein DFQ30_002424, partial [Apophysomyces sp. BC1015]
YALDNDNENETEDLTDATLSLNPPSPIQTSTVIRHARRSFDDSILTACQRLSASKDDQIMTLCVNNLVKMIKDGSNANDEEASLLSMQHYGPYTRQLSKRTFVQLDNLACDSLNIIESYGRSPSLDAHRYPSASSLPPVTIKYSNTWATILVGREGKKFIIGTKSMNALVTSSLRIDTILPASIGGIVSNFDLDKNDSNASIFLDQETVDLANQLVRNCDTDMITQFDPLHQIRQLRSKFYSPSIFLLCRASRTSHPRPRLLREIAVQVFKTHGSVLAKEFVPFLVDDYPDTNYKKQLMDVLELFGDNESITILGNYDLDNVLQPLADSLSSDIASSNEIIAENVKSRVMDGR